MSDLEPSKRDDETHAEAMDRLTELLLMRSRDNVAAAGKLAWRQAIDATKKAKGEG